MLVLLVLLVLQLVCHTFPVLTVLVSLFHLTVPPLGSVMVAERRVHLHGPTPLSMEDLWD